MKPANKQAAPKASAKRVAPLPPPKRGGHHNKEENSKKYREARAALKDVRVGRPRNDPSRPRYDEVDDALAEEFEKLVGLGTFIKIIGGLHPSDDIYFVLAVEESSSDVISLAIEQNIDELLVKPFSTDNIHQIVERYLSKQKTQRAPWYQDLRMARSADVSKRYQGNFIQIWR